MVKYFSRISNDVDTINQSLSQSLTEIITSIVTIFGILYMMFTINWILTLVALVILPVAILIMGLIVRKSQKYFQQQQDFLGHLNGYIEEMYGGHVVMKVFNGEEKSVESFDDSNKKWKNGSWKAQFLSGLTFPLIQFVPAIWDMSLLLSSAAGYRLMGPLAWVTSKRLSNMYNYLTSPYPKSRIFPTLFSKLPLLSERVFQFLSEPEEMPDTANPIKLKMWKGL